MPQKYGFGESVLHNPPRPVAPPARHLAQVECADEVQRALPGNFERVLDHAGRHQRT